MIIALKDGRDPQGAARRIEIEEMTSRHRDPLVKYVELALSTVNDVERVKERFSRIPAPTGEEPSYFEILRGLWALAGGDLAAAAAAFRGAYAMYPKNHYALALLLGLGTGGERFDSWARARKHELATWDGNEDLFVIGDSHSYYCYGGIARARIFVFPRRTLYMFPSMGGEIAGVIAGLRRHGTAIFCYGYNDIHIHLKTVAEQRGVAPDQIMEELLQGYVAALRAHTRDRPDITILLSNVVPTSPRWPLPYPYHGAPAERAALTRRFNAMLQEHAARAGLPVVDIHSPFTDGDGFMRPEVLAEDGIHTTCLHHHPVEAQVAAALAAPL